MSREADFIESLRRIAAHPAARGLNDDAAVLPFGAEKLVITHDMMVEGVHWLPDADPADIAWKLAAVNLSDLAAKGAEPLGVMLGFTLGADSNWDARFNKGLEQVLAEYDVPLLGGDTVSGAPETPARTLGLTALGRATCDPVPARSGAQPGDTLWVTGTLGDAKAGFLLAQQGSDGAAPLLQAFHRPRPLLQQGQTLAAHVHAMMDVSDGLLLDAGRMSKASGLRLVIALDAVPLSKQYRALHGADEEARLAAASWGDDYQLLFALPSQVSPPVSATSIGSFSEGQGLDLRYGDKARPLPESLGYLHG